MKKLSFVLILLSALAAGPTAAEIAVVAHPGSQVVSLDRSQLINIYMGRYRQLPTGEAAHPADLGPLKERFYRALVNKDQAEINSYWARLVFSGQVAPPQQFDSVADMLSYVRQNPGALGFVEMSQAPPDLQVVYRLAEASPR